MEKTNLEKIKEEVTRSANFPGCVLEYNFDKLPKIVTKTSFFGVPAKFNENKKKNTVGIIFKY